MKQKSSYEYRKSINGFVTLHSWTTEALYSSAVDNLAFGYGKTADEIRADIRRAYMARTLPPGTMFNIQTPVAYHRHKTQQITRRESQPRRPGR